MEAIADSAATRYVRAAHRSETFAPSKSLPTNTPLVSNHAKARFEALYSTGSVSLADFLLGGSFCLHSALQHGVFHIIDLTILELLALAVVPVLHGTVVAGDAAVNLSFLAADGASVLLAGEVAMLSADGICRT